MILDRLDNTYAHVLRVLNSHSIGLSFEGKEGIFKKAAFAISMHEDGKKFWHWAKANDADGDMMVAVTVDLRILWMSRQLENFFEETAIEYIGENPKEWIADDATAKNFQEKFYTKRFVEPNILEIKTVSGIKRAVYQAFRFDHKDSRISIACFKAI